MSVRKQKHQSPRLAGKGHARQKEASVGKRWGRWAVSKDGVSEGQVPAPNAPDCQAMELALFRHGWEPLWSPEQDSNWGRGEEEVKKAQAEKGVEEVEHSA